VIQCARKSNAVRSRISGITALPEPGEQDWKVRFGKAVDTVKNHLRRVYDKTGTSRQLNPTKIIAQFSNPLLE
jgi:hypothetical protein